MKIIDRINVKKVDELQNNIYLTLNDSTEVKLNLLIKGLKELIESKYPKVYIITGEDIYGEDGFDEEIQDKLENEEHANTNVFYDAKSCFQSKSNVGSTIVELREIEVRIFTSMLSSSLFTYIYVYFGDKNTTVSDIRHKFSIAKNQSDIEKSMLNQGIFVIPSGEGGTVVIKCTISETDNLLNYFQKL